MATLAIITFVTFSYLMIGAAISWIAASAGAFKKGETQGYPLFRIILASVIFWPIFSLVILVMAFKNLLTSDK